MNHQVIRSSYECKKGRRKSKMKRENGSEPKAGGTLTEEFKDVASGAC